MPLDQALRGHDGSGLNFIWILDRIHIHVDKDRAVIAKDEAENASLEYLRKCQNLERWFLPIVHPWQKQSNLRFVAAGVYEGTIPSATGDRGSDPAASTQKRIIDPVRDFRYEDMQNEDTEDAPPLPTEDDAEEG